MALKGQVSNVYGVGVRNVGSYQVSGTPWVTGSATLTSFATDKTVRYRFEYISKSITVINTGNNVIRLHFAAGSGVTVSATDGAQVAGDNADDVNLEAKHHYITVPASNGSVTLDVKCKEFYLSNHSGGTSGYEVLAELTGIPTGRMFDLTGSGITG